MIAAIPKGSRRIIVLNLIGKNGSGKSVQRKKLCDKYNLYTISTGDIARDMRNKKIKSDHHLYVLQTKFHENSFSDLMSAGNLLPNDFIKEIVSAEMAYAFKKGFRGVVFDGAVRNAEQAANTDMMLEDLGFPISATIFLNVSDEEIHQRCAGRYEVENREDDSPEKVTKRLEVFNEQTAPLSAYYTHPMASPPLQIDGMGTPEQVFARIQPFTDLLLRTNVCYIK